MSIFPISFLVGNAAAERAKSASPSAGPKGEKTFDLQAESATVDTLLAAPPQMSGGWPGGENPGLRKSIDVMYYWYQGGMPDRQLWRFIGKAFKYTVDFEEDIRSRQDAGPDKDKTDLALRQVRWAYRQIYDLLRGSNCFSVQDPRGLLDGQVISLEEYFPKTTGSMLGCFVRFPDSPHLAEALDRYPKTLRYDKERGLLIIRGKLENGARDDLSGIFTGQAEKEALDLLWRNSQMINNEYYRGASLVGAIALELELDEVQPEDIEEKLTELELARGDLRAHAERKRDTDVMIEDVKAQFCQAKLLLRQDCRTRAEAAEMYARVEAMMPDLIDDVGEVELYGQSADIYRAQLRAEALLLKAEAIAWSGDVARQLEAVAILHQAEDTVGDQRGLDWLAAEIHHELGNALALVGWDLEAAGKTKQGQEYLRQSLASLGSALLQARTSGDSKRVPKILRMMAKVYLTRPGDENAAQALASYRQAIAAGLARVSKPWELAEVAADYADILAAAGCDDQAEEMYRQAIESAEKYLVLDYGELKEASLAVVLLKSKAGLASLLAGDVSKAEETEMLASDVEATLSQGNIEAGGRSFPLEVTVTEKTRLGATAKLVRAQCLVVRPEDRNRENIDKARAEYESIVKPQEETKSGRPVIYSQYLVVKAYFGLAELAVWQGDFDCAVEIYAKLTGDQGTVDEQLGQGEATIANSSRSLCLRARLALGQVLGFSKEYAKAEIQFIRVIKDAEKLDKFSCSYLQSQAYYERAKIRSYQGDYQEALADYKQAMGRLDDDYLVNGKKDLDVLDGSQQRALRMARMEIQLGLADDLKMAKQYGRAVEEYDRANALAEKMSASGECLAGLRFNLAALLGKAEVLTYRGDHAAAEAALAEAREISGLAEDDTYPDGQEEDKKYILAGFAIDLTTAEARLEKARQRPERAFALYEAGIKAIDSRPLPAEAIAEQKMDWLYQQGLAARDEGHYNLALEKFAEIEKMIADDKDLVSKEKIIYPEYQARIALERAKIESQRGRYAVASSSLSEFRVFLQGLDLKDESLKDDLVAEADLELGRVCLARGRYDDAVAIFQMLVPVVIVASRTDDVPSTAQEVSLPSRFDFRMAEYAVKAEIGLAEAEKGRGCYAQALDAYRHALDKAESLDDAMLKEESLRQIGLGLAQTLSAWGRYDMENKALAATICCRLLGWDSDGPIVDPTSRITKIIGSDKEDRAVIVAEHKDYQSVMDHLAAEGPGTMADGYGPVDVVGTVKAVLAVLPQEAAAAKTPNDGVALLKTRFAVQAAQELGHILSDSYEPVLALTAYQSAWDLAGDLPPDQVLGARGQMADRRIALYAYTYQPEEAKKVYENFFAWQLKEADVATGAGPGVSEGQWLAYQRNLVQVRSAWAMRWIFEEDFGRAIEEYDQALADLGQGGSCAGLSPEVKEELELQIDLDRAKARTWKKDEYESVALDYNDIEKKTGGSRNQRIWRIEIETVFALAEHQRNFGYNGSAQKIYRETIPALCQGDPEAEYVLDRAQIGQALNLEGFGENEAATTILKGILKTNPRNFLAEQALADVHKNTNNPEVKTVVSHLASIDPFNRELKKMAREIDLQQDGIDFSLGYDFNKASLEVRTQVNLPAWKWGNHSYKPSLQFHTEMAEHYVDWFVVWDDLRNRVTDQGPVTRLVVPLGLSFNLLTIDDDNHSQGGLTLTHDWVTSSDYNAKQVTLSGSASAQLWPSNEVDKANSLGVFAQARFSLLYGARWSEAYQLWRSRDWGVATRSSQISYDVRAGLNFSLGQNYFWAPLILETSLGYQHQRYNQGSLGLDLDNLYANVVSGELAFSRCFAVFREGSFQTRLANSWYFPIRQSNDYQGSDPATQPREAVIKQMASENPLMKLELSAKMKFSRTFPLTLEAGAGLKITGEDLFTKENRSGGFSGWARFNYDF